MITKDITKKVKGFDEKMIEVSNDFKLVCNLYYGEMVYLLTHIQYSNWIESVEKGDFRISYYKTHIGQFKIVVDEYDSDDLYNEYIKNKLKYNE